ncbi:MAG: O-antigen ligase family protein [Phycisphaerae bacterium]|jgi:hypothetical protein
MNERVMEQISLTGVACVLGAMTLRCVIGTDPFPYASADVFTTGTPALAITPKWSFVIDAFMLLASAAMLCVQIAQKRGPAWWQCGVLGLAGTVLLAHINPRATDGMDNAVLGVQWLSNFIASVAMMGVLRENARARGLVIATLTAIAIATSLRGAYQVFVEHAQTMATFNANKQSYFAAQGWSPDSPMARAFTRRISQAEATGWFGMANVAATLFAACGVLLAGLGVHAWKTRTSRDAAPGWMLGSVIGGCIACVVGVVLAGAKGGYAALALGIAVLIVMMLAERREKLAGLVTRGAGFIAPAVIAMVLLAVVVRGLVGERLGELSIWFRSMYLEAAIRIAGQHPLTGTGPAGFKDAYLLAKNPLSPEEVALPHSVLADLIATLGVGGLALAGLWVFLAWRAGAALAVREENASTLTVREIARPVFVVLAFAAIAAGYLERAAPLIDMVGLRIAVIAIGGVVGVAAAMLAARSARVGAVALGAAALAFIAQSQIELSGTQPGAMMWGLALLLAAGSMGPRVREMTAPPLPSKVTALVLSGKHITALLVLLCGVYVLGCGFWWMKTRGWEGSLRRAADEAGEVRELVMRRNDLATGTATPEAVESLRSDLAKFIGRAVPANPAGIDRALEAAKAKALPGVVSAMDRAARSNGSHLGTVRALTTVQMQHLVTKMEAGEVAREEMDVPILTMRQFGEPLARKTTYWSWLGTLYAERAARITNDEELRRSDWLAAIDNWTRAHELAPFNTLHAVKIADAAAQLGDNAAASQWAKIALSVSEQMRLDPLVQLSESEQRRMRGLAGTR